MAKKRKTLVENFQEIINSGDLDAFAAVFDRCEINAVASRGSSCNAFSFQNLTPAHLRILIDRGLDVNGNCGFHRSAIFYQSRREDNLDFLLKNGAELNLVLTRYVGTALYCAAMRRDEASVKNLVERGADLKGRYGLDDRTVLEELLFSSSNADLPRTLRLSRCLLDAGAERTPECQTAVRKLGENFEFFRADFNPDFVDECSDALDGLYELFAVEPIPRRVLYDGKTPIRVQGDSWQEQYQALWDLLVPGKGPASTVQGEVIRVTGRVLHELLDNGGVNWDRDFRAMLRALSGYLRQSGGLDQERTEEAIRLASQTGAHTEETQLYRLEELVVAWVLANPEPIPLGKVPYRR